MEKIWKNYIKHTSAFEFGIEIPLNEKNYVQKILEFDACLFDIGAQYGVYNFIELEKINRGEAQKYLNDYVSFRKKNMFKPNAEFIALGAFYQWDYYPNLVNYTTTIPVFENGQWLYKAIDTFGIIDYSSMMENVDIDIKTTKVWNDVVIIEFHSSSNIWYDEIEDWQLDFYKPDILPVNNRPVAYRMSPRFNSFLRELKAKTYSLKGEYILYGHGGKLSEEGYILIDGQVIFQEDIDSGKVKIPD